MCIDFFDSARRGDDKCFGGAQATGAGRDANSMLGYVLTSQ